LVAAAIGVWTTKGPTPPIQIDGSFADWSSVPMFDVATPSSDPSLQISRYADLLDPEHVYLFVRMQGATFGDPLGYTGVDFLIDTDGNATTGFVFGALGADHVVQVSGTNGTVRSAILYSFPEDAGLNWSRKEGGISVGAAAGAAGLEVAIPRLDLPSFLEDRYRIAVVSDNFRGDSSRSEVPLSAGHRAVLLNSVPLTPILDQNLTDFLEIGIRAIGPIPAGSTWTVSSLRLDTTPGLLTSLSTESVNLTRDRPNATIRVAVLVPGFLPGTVVQVQLLGADAPVPAVILGEPARAYFLSVPPGIRIDGLFSDWLSYDTSDSDPSPVNNTDVDIVRGGAVVNGTAVAFHVQVAGTLLEGAIPVRYSPPGPGGGSGGGGRVVPLARLTGEDVLRVYIQLNASLSQGFPFGGISADYMLETSGDAGRINSCTLHVWSNRWVAVSTSTLAVAKNATDIEGLVGIGPTTNRTLLVIATTDWSGIGDATVPITATVIPPMPPVGTFIVYAMPEFEDLGLPIACTLLVILFFGRRRRLPRSLSVAPAKVLEPPGRSAD
jgi:hypothetical protein